jgi:hypothetical protein
MNGGSLARRGDNIARLSKPCRKFKPKGYKLPDERAIRLCRYRSKKWEQDVDRKRLYGSNNLLL